MPNDSGPAETLLEEIENEIRDKLDIADLLVGRAQSSTDFSPAEAREAESLLVSLRRIEALLDGWHIAHGRVPVDASDESR